jgi:hypothetical protein
MSSGAFAHLFEKAKSVPIRKPVIAMSFLLAVSFATVTLGQHSPQDPGVRGGTVNSGQPLSSISQTPGAPAFLPTGCSASRKSNPFRAAQTTDSDRASIATSVRVATHNPPSAAQARVPRSFPRSARIPRLWFTASMVPRTLSHPSLLPTAPSAKLGSNSF